MPAFFTPRPARLDLSDRRRLFTVGDVHGCFDLLDRKLDEVGFDGSQDTLVLLGDLIDRGPQSHRVLEFLGRPGIHSIVGNHEMMLIEAWDNQDSPRFEADFMRNGGGWFRQLGHDDRELIVSTIRALPLSIEALSPAGRTVGFLHAGLPGHDWSILDPVSPPASAQAIADLVWDRDVITDALRFLQLGGDPADFPEVTGIHHVFHGHSIVRRAVTLGNRSWIDTGAFRSGELTLIDVDEWLDDFEAYVRLDAA